MEQQKTDLKQWAIATRQAKIMELEAALRFILRNQKFDVFFDANDGETKARGFQGRMFVDGGGDNDEAVLFVNWDEVNAFDDQQALFEGMFEGDFSSDKTAKITGVKL